MNARFAGPHTETPLHWAASSDDVAMIDALLDAGAATWVGYDDLTPAAVAAREGHSALAAWLGARPRRSGG